MPNTESATFAAGCFWGVEKVFKKEFKDAGIETRVGYTGGDVPNPTYKQVCSGTTQHAESIQIKFDPEKVSYATLVEHFYKTHDPTTKYRQGNDIGSQYRSAIFYHSQEQKQIAEQVTEQVRERALSDKSLYQNSNIETEIVAAGVFYDAEDYHQNYLVSINV
ncbi:7311_t:CDS:2 [Paraglomus brasilianum]|uniref:peptide-methionine (S)-S-oxide reductase n=1 Tax=Paraglomus brasilianum TaxID=144538 RepID=A0A9N9AA39_9GLOM|nr:7311_t:CDS:2 [Paraglomus brasilianum]